MSWTLPIFQAAILPFVRGMYMTPAEAPEERQIFCSGCLKIFSESQVHVIPYFNSSVNAHVTTYRCEQCWIPALEETRTRLANTHDEAEIASAGAFFQKHGVHIHEFLRGDPAPVVQKRLLQTIDLLRSEAIRLSIGTDIPSPKLPELPLKQPQSSSRLRHWFSSIFGR